MLLLLYADPNGDLRVVITIRAKTLSSCMLCSLLRSVLFGWFGGQPCFQGVVLVLVLHDLGLR